MTEPVELSPFEAIFGTYAAYTMSPHVIYNANLALADRVAEIPGAIVECGVWKGGMIAGIAQLLGDDREYWLFDSFEGLPPIEDIDGEIAHTWITAGVGTDTENCATDQSYAQEAMKLSGVTNYHIIPGWFADTLTADHFPDGIAFLRLDADFYTPMTEALDALFGSVNAGGIISIDDYFNFDGCARAVHDYLSQHQRCERIESAVDVDAPHDAVAFLRKLP